MDFAHCLVFSLDSQSTQHWVSSYVLFIIIICTYIDNNYCFLTGNFVQRPENVTVYLILGSVASFTCEIDLGDSDGILWYATEANTPYSLLPAEYGAVTRTYDLPNNILSSTLTINALETTNNTRVLCRGIRFTGQDIFSTAYMTIYKVIIK